MNQRYLRMTHDQCKIKMTLKTGDVIIETLPKIAPKHVAQICNLVRRGFYNGLKFHRVIDGFMAQTGCPNGNGTGGSGTKIPAEFSHEHFTRGSIGMARTNEINSADSQFFICLADCEFLNGKYTLWGRVVSGMDNIDKIAKGDPYNNGHVGNPDKIISMSIID
ncbi:MAG: peptidylprolyl isomerase [Alphaproteobacteria bacterium]|nr:peptidylprolyl isomerase [Alphaproteobacteria bacterium]